MPNIEVYFQKQPKGNVSTVVKQGIYPQTVRPFPYSGPVYLWTDIIDDRGDVYVFQSKPDWWDEEA